jgi:hypothetical protein
LNVRSGLDPENLQEDISGGAGCNSHIEWRSRKGRTRIGCYLGRRCKVFHSASLWFGSCCRRNNTLLDSFLAAILLTVDAGSLPVHRAVHTHLTHRHAAAMNARSTIWIAHGAQQSGEGRLSRKRRNHGQGDDLEEPLHQLEKDYI